MKRMRIIVSGIVQGVAFRAWTVRTARARGVTGWVRNLPDGRVEALVEGEDEAVDAVAAWCRQGPPAATVTNMEAREEPYSGEFQDFRIRY
ncbi:MAG: acylphosphatase [Syntrophaceae bacterium]|nr:acylphosphatase [Syntrophaceae bacterium]